MSSKRQREEPDTDDTDIASNVELERRMIRLEERQETTIGKLDNIQDSLDEEVTEIRDAHSNLRSQHKEMWMGFQLIKWGGGSAGLLALGVSLAVQIM